jgi:hypothetical protein
VEKTSYFGSPWSVLPTHYCAGDKTENNDIVGACSAYGGGERIVQGFGGES